MRTVIHISIDPADRPPTPTHTYLIIVLLPLPPPHQQVLHILPHLAGRLPLNKLPALAPTPTTAAAAAAAPVGKHAGGLLFSMKLLGFVEGMCGWWSRPPCTHRAHTHTLTQKNDVFLLSQLFYFFKQKYSSIYNHIHDYETQIFYISIPGWSRPSYIYVYDDDTQILYSFLHHHINMYI